MKITPKLPEDARSRGIAALKKARAIALPILYPQPHRPILRRRT